MRASHGAIPMRSQRAAPPVFSLTQIIVAVSSALIILLQTNTLALLTEDPEKSRMPFDYHLPFYLAALIILFGYIPVIFVEDDF